MFSSAEGTKLTQQQVIFQLQSQGRNRYEANTIPFHRLTSLEGGNIICQLSDKIFHHFYCLQQESSGLGIKRKIHPLSL